MHGAYDRAKKEQAARAKRAEMKAAMTDEERVSALVAAGLSKEAAEKAVRAKPPAEVEPAPEEEPTVG